MGITLITKEIKPKNNFYRNEVQYRDDVPTKRKVGIFSTLRTHPHCSRLLAGFDTGFFARGGKPYF